MIQQRWNEWSNCWKLFDLTVQNYSIWRTHSATNERKSPPPQINTCLIESFCYIRRNSQQIYARNYSKILRINLPLNCTCDGNNDAHTYVVCLRSKITIESSISIGFILMPNLYTGPFGAGRIVNVRVPVFVTLTPVSNRGVPPNDAELSGAVMDRAGREAICQEHASSETSEEICKGTAS